MSLNRGVAALGAVAVVGVATLGITIPIAHSVGKPQPMVQVTSGGTWVQTAALPGCYLDGKVLDATAQAKCLKSLNAQVTNNAVPNIPVGSNGTLLFTVDKDVAAKGWQALTTSGTPLVSNSTAGQAGPIPTTGIFTDSQTGATSKTVVMRVLEAVGQNVYGVWQFQLTNKAA